MTGKGSQPPFLQAAAPEQGEAPAVAVALEHDADSPNAPRVSASGRGWMAEQILALAFAHGVKVRQDAALAQILAALDVDSEIPTEAFLAVAEILAYVYQADSRMKMRQAQDAPP